MKSKITGKKNDLQQEGLGVKVKSIRETTYEALEKSGKIEKGGITDFSVAIFLQ